MPSVYLLLLGVLANAAPAAMYSGSLSYSSGLYATEDWAASGTTLSWTVTNEDPAAPTGYPWKYIYTIDIPSKAVSHFIVEASNGESPFTIANLNGVSGAGTPVADDITTHPATGSSDPNPGMPDALYGIKFELLPEVDPLVVSFYSDRDPVWGDFYAKDGKTDNNPVYLYNTGFSASDPVGPPTDGHNQNHLLVPDTIPEPGLIVLLAAGGLGLLRRRKR